MTGGGWAERPLDGDDRDAEHLWILQQDEDDDEDDDWDEDDEEGPGELEFGAEKLGDWEDDDPDEAMGW